RPAFPSRSTKLRSVTRSPTPLSRGVTTTGPSRTSCAATTCPRTIRTNTLAHPTLPIGPPVYTSNKDSRLYKPSRPPDRYIRCTPFLIRQVPDASSSYELLPLHRHRPLRRLQFRQ